MGARRLLYVSVGGHVCVQIDGSREGMGEGWGVVWCEVVRRGGALCRVLRGGERRLID